MFFHKELTIIQNSFIRIIFVIDYYMLNTLTYWGTPSYIRLLTTIYALVFLILSAQIKIPLNPIPISLIPTSTLFLALFLGKKEALNSIISLLLLCGIGAPIFESNGLNAFVGAKGGYYFGMLLCTYVITTMRQIFGENKHLLFIYSIIGTVCIYAVGVPHLALYVGWDNCVQLGLYPFIIPGILKSFLAYFIIIKIKKIR